MADSTFKRMRALPLRDKGLLAGCAVGLPLIAAALRLWDFRRVASVLRGTGSAPATAGGEPREHRAGLAHGLAALVRAAARRGPYRARCLEESLLLWWLLRRRGIEGRLRLGVRKDGSLLVAHAWVELDGQAIGDRQGLTCRYAPFGKDFAEEA